MRAQRTAKELGKRGLKRIGRLGAMEIDISRELVSGGGCKYSAKAAQIDLNRLTGETYTLVGDTWLGYEIIHTATGRKVVSGYSPKESVIIAVALLRSADD